MKKEKVKTDHHIRGRLLLISGICLVFVPGALYIRMNPVWKEAELTIEPANRSWEIQCIEPSGTTLEARILPPEGFTRTPAEDGSFQKYLRDYPLLPDDTKLPVYDGTAMDYSDAAAIFDISLGREGYQQCADTVIRLYSDYFYESGQPDRISFSFTNGDECSYNSWRRGKRMLVLGGLSCELPAAFPDDSRQAYMNYLREVMNYAGTLSLKAESETIPAEELKAGDIICSDAHVVMITDVAENEKGEKCYLIGQSFIPAVCYHILTWTEGKQTSPWFTQDQLSADRIVIGGFSFRPEDIRRWKGGL